MSAERKVHPSSMVTLTDARKRLKLLGIATETRFDGAQRVWLHWSKPGKSGQIRVFSAKIFEHKLVEVENGR